MRLPGGVLEFGVSFLRDRRKSLRPLTIVILIASPLGTEASSLQQVVRKELVAHIIHAAHPCAAIGIGIAKGLCVVASEK